MKEGATFPNFDLLDYLFLDYTLGYNNINFYTCSCGYPECGGFYGIPYVIFNSGGDTLVQMLLDESLRYTRRKQDKQGQGDTEYVEYRARR